MKSADQEHELNFSVHPSSPSASRANPKPNPLVTPFLHLWAGHDSCSTEAKKPFFPDIAVMFTGVSKVTAVIEDAPVGNKGHNRGSTLRVTVI